MSQADPFRDDSSVVFNVEDESNDSRDSNNTVDRDTVMTPVMSEFTPVNTGSNPFGDPEAMEGHDEVLLERHGQDQAFSNKPETGYYEMDDSSYSDIDFNHMPTGLLKGTFLLYFTSAFVSLGVFVFGYDQGVMSGIITERAFVQYFDDPTKAQIGTVVAILEIGALLSSLSVGKIGDSLGRKNTILLGAIIFFVGGLLQCFSIKMWILILGRIISGISIGILSATVPMYQTEISPPSSRGKLGCIQFSGNICGYMASVWVDYSCSFADSQTSWRLPLFLQSALGFILFAGGLFIVESPRWLLEKNKDAEGFHVLNLLFADSPHGTARSEFHLIKKSIVEERIASPLYTRTYKVMFKKYWYRLMIACTALMWAQINGINVVCYYAPMLFEAAGFKNEMALLVTGLNSIVYLLATIPSWFLVDKWGRKPILMSGGVAMGIALLVISFAEWLDKPASHIVVAIFVVIYMALFATSWGPIPWLMCEILPLQVRAKGVSLSTATNWVFNYLVGQMTPILLDKIGYRLYLIHGCFCLCSAVFVWKFFPETRGVELEDMDKLFNDTYQPVEQHDTASQEMELHNLNRIETQEDEMRRTIL